MSDDTKLHEDQAHETMPPELRPFAKPVPPQRLVAPEDEAEFKAALEALRLLNGGPAADPFYVDAKNDPAGERKAEPSVTAYVPPVAVPAAEAKVRRVNDDVQAIDMRRIREKLEARFAGKKSEKSEKSEGEAPEQIRGAPAEKVVVAVVDRPEQLAVGDASAATDAVNTRAFQGASGHEAKVEAAKPAGAASGGRALRVAGMVVLGVAAVLLVLFRGMSCGQAQRGPAELGVPQSAAPAPIAPSATVSAAPAAPASMDSVAPLPSASAPGSAAVLQAPMAEPRPRNAASEVPGKDAAVPAPSALPKATAAPSVSPSIKAAVPPSSAQPAVTGAPTSMPSANPNPIAGERTFGN